MEGTWFVLDMKVHISDGVKLNLVVCGSDGTLKSSISEQILQQTDRRSDVEISLVELPALCNPRLSEEEVIHQTSIHLSSWSSRFSPHYS
ncbi:hypothetical protein QQF64_025603 [Cirrhinus molitorella]|uniref:Uncharacterized protein n=1 Tax=Cirrhinus molitorella TaxID=172907 RepID=A0ABR3NPY3_9TELE